MKRWIKISLLTVGTVSLLSLFSYAQNNMISTTHLTVASENIPPSFEGFKIVQLSDLHNKSFGSEQERIIRRVKSEQPDIIVFTGDLFDSNRLEMEPGITLMSKLTTVAPVYFITGNHEYWAQEISIDSLEELLEQEGVEVLRNTSLEITHGEDAILLAGVDDPAEAVDKSMQKELLHSYINSALEGNNDFYTILLSHRPELFSLYQEHNIDLIFSGHAHGGQFRLPFAGGFYAPDQGFFPEYTSGKYEEQESTMIVNRGLGNSVIPQRIFNRPEITSVTLDVSDE